MSRATGSIGLNGTGLNIPPISLIAYVFAGYTNFLCLFRSIYWDDEFITMTRCYPPSEMVALIVTPACLKQSPTTVGTFLKDRLTSFCLYEESTSLLVVQHPLRDRKQSPFLFGIPP